MKIIYPRQSGKPFTDLEALLTLAMMAKKNEKLLIDSRPYCLRKVK